MKEQNGNDLILHEKVYNHSEKNRSFSGFIKEKRKLEANSSGKSISTRELAERLDIGYEQFRKILNMHKPIKKQDCIIAICAALKLDSEETNEALILYRYMPTLDTENPRDDLLIDILENQFSNPLTIEDINNCLVRNGFPVLDIIDHRIPTTHPSKRMAMPYKLLEKRVRSSAGDLFWDDPYASLSTAYDIGRYRCFSDMWLDDQENKIVYELTAGADGSCTLATHGKHIEIKTYKNPNDAGDFKDYFLELYGMARSELKKMLSTLNDTKNYSERIGAEIQDDQLHIFAETFNFTVPETGEYYMYESIGSQVKLSVYRNSEFMRRYLPEEDYLRTYGKKENHPLVCYNSMKELEQAAEEAPYYSAPLIKSRLRAFKHLSQKTNELKQDLIARKTFVRRLDYIYEDVDRVCEFFGVENEFHCVLDAEYGAMMSATTDHADFSLSDGSRVTITLHDLYNAFELGFNDIQEICRVKQKTGSVSSVL